MAVLKFIKSIHEDSPITVYGDGNQTRDFTHVDDVVSAIDKVLANSKQEFSLLNVGCGNSTSVKTLIKLIETALNKKAVVMYKPSVRSDMRDTKASYEKLHALG